MTFAARAREARIAAAMETLADPEASARDVSEATAAIASRPTDLRKLDDHELSIWIFLRERLAGREPESDDGARRELATHAQALADDLAARAPASPGCRRCRGFTDEDLDDLRAVVPLALRPGEPDHE